MNLVLEFIATLSAGLFCGAAIYINLVEHPARMSCGTVLAVTEFVPSYKRATVMQVLLAAISFICSLIAWLIYPNIYWLIGAILIIIVIPFTVIFILPTNKKLLDSSLDKDFRLYKTTFEPVGKITCRPKHIKSGLIYHFFVCPYLDIKDCVCLQSHDRTTGGLVTFKRKGIKGEPGIKNRLSIVLLFYQFKNFRTITGTHFCNAGVGY